MGRGRCNISRNATFPLTNDLRHLPLQTVACYRENSPLRLPWELLCLSHTLSIAGMGRGGEGLDIAKNCALWL